MQEKDEGADAKKQRLRQTKTRRRQSAAAGIKEWATKGSGPGSGAETADNGLEFAGHLLQVLGLIAHLIA